MKHSISSAVDRINYLRSVIFVFLCFGLFFAFVKYEHKVYLSNYKNRQIQEEKTATKKIITTIKELKSLVMVVSKTITTHSGDHQKIQTILASGVQVAKDYNIPTIQHITYCSTSNPKELITSSAIFPTSCHNYCSFLHKPVNELESLTTKDNHLIGSVPVFDQKSSLKGVLQVSVPFADMQKFIGIEKMLTLEFPKIFDENGRRIIQNDLFNFSLRNPLMFREYLAFYRSEFFILSFIATLGAFFLMLTNSGVGQLVNAEISYRASLEAYNSIQRLLIQRFKETTRAIYKSMEYVVSSNNSSSSLSHAEKLDLINTTKELAEDLSYGATWVSYKKNPIKINEELNQAQMYFNDLIQKRSIVFCVKCPQDLIFIGDPLLTRTILLNVIGHPICSMPNKGKISITVKQENGFVHLEILDNRYNIGASAQPYLEQKYLFEFFIESSALRQLCLKNGLGYEFTEKEKGQFHTKVCLPLDSDKADDSNVVKFM